ncbi:MAG TPA: cytochrome c3 family protein [Gemmatimonadales bacterium]|nr:cytochrome c3 family protein [Gemmatimonadales bacterium]
MATVRTDLGAASGGVLVAALVLAVFVGSAEAQRPRNTCVACHSLQSGTTEAGHGFAAWRSSPHAAAGITCEACHGGNPAAPDPADAHKGVNPSGDPASRVYFSRVPQTCGQCHASEAGYFRTSVHYARLQSDGRGPNCVTCHGSMATRILTPDSALGTCTACHAAGGVAPVGKAREAAQVLALVRAENILFDIVSSSVSSARATPGARRARVLLDDAERHLDAAAEVWHSFRLDSATARLGDARELLADAWAALGHPKPREGQLHRPVRPARP